LPRRLPGIRLDLKGAVPFVIDLDPVAFSLFGIPIRWYGLTLAAAVLVAVWLAEREGRRRGMEASIVSDGVLWVGVAALVGGRLLYVVQNELASLPEHPLHLVMVWMGGLSFYGGLMGALLALVVFARRRGLPVRLALDVAAPSAAIGQAIGHLGCLVGGDSYGIATDLPWAVIYSNPGAMAPLGIPLHPTQAYEAISLVVLFVGLSLGRERLSGLGSGAVAGAYLLGLATIRFGLFFLRDEPAALLGLKTAQLIGVAIALLALVLLLGAARHARSMGTLDLDASRP
jgi:phosphatidylglycerol---prolipoprotein diacylglyceryl transferase